MKLAAITLTRQGIEVCRRIEAAFPETTVMVAAKYDSTAPRHWRRFEGKLAPLVAEIFPAFEGFVFVMATGIVVRMIAPYIVDKRYDPAVVVVDITGRFAVSLCAGHMGGANELARQIADVLGAVPVITTGTDVNETLAPDLLAKSLGAEIENWDALKTVSGALVDAEPVAVFAEPNVRLPDLSHLASRDVHVVAAPSEIDSRFAAAVIVSHRKLAESEVPSVPTIFIRPRCLVLGIGCDRGVTRQEIDEAVTRVFEQQRLSELSIRNVATYVLKKDEDGLLEFVRARKLPLEWFDREAINAIEDFIPTPSDVVFKYTGVVGVAEPAAMLSAGTRQVIVPKVKAGRLTLAVALVPESGVL